MSLILPCPPTKTGRKRKYEAPAVDSLFGKLTVIGREVLEWTGTRGHRKIPCRCECGTEKLIHLVHLLEGRTISCGCDCWGHSGHGLSDHPLNNIWKSMKARCDCPSYTRYENWGGRGISYCPEWSNFMPFYEWAITHGYQEGLTLDRIENDGNYEPGNCKWSTDIEQARNTRANHLLTAFGEIKCIAEWAEDPRCVVSKYTLRTRVASGNPHEWSIITPSYKKVENCKMCLSPFGPLKNMGRGLCPKCYTIAKSSGSLTSYAKTKMP